MLNQFFDSVVMLTWSNWHTEPRSNRYHYACRFSRHMPVLFVQPDLKEKTFKYESTELENIYILHIYNFYGKKQAEIFQSAMRERNVIRPLIWTYNFLFREVHIGQYSPLKVYHATEDYYSDFYHLEPEKLLSLKSTLQNSDILIAVSEGVKERYDQIGHFRGRAFVLKNGCDFYFWSQSYERKPDFEEDKVVLYQGGINQRLDFHLLMELVQKLPDWDFLFCGRLFFPSDESAKAWKHLCSFPNVRYLGELSPTELRDVLHQSNVGIIPYEQKGYIKRSLPLKAFEYVACGLPVVTVPIDSLSNHPEIFQFAKTADEFSAEIIKAEPTRYDLGKIKLRQEEARKTDYDGSFNRLLSELEDMLKNPAIRSSESLNILALYDKNSIHVPTVREHLESFSRYSENQIYYMHASTGMAAMEPAECPIDLAIFDSIIIHYSIRLSLTWHISENFARKIRCYGGLKILFIQDEYDFTNTARNWIKDLGIHLVFTCVPRKYTNSVYPIDQFPQVEFIQSLTGYVPMQAERLDTYKPHATRQYVIGYRGRALPYWYGLLGHEKLMIGKRMRQICDNNNIKTSIEWEDSKRIYHDDWYKFLENCNATLGTESGSNIFDYDGEISKTIQSALQVNPDMTFEEAYERYLKEHEGKVIMNQISPKIFEAVAARTALVLFEGNYSGVIRPNKHYISLKKDFSNVNEVLSKLQDIDFLTELTERTYKDVIGSGKYSYRKIIRDFDNLILERIRRGKGTICTSLLSGYQESGAKDICLVDSRLTFSRPVHPERYEVPQPPPPVSIPNWITSTYTRIDETRRAFAERAYSNGVSFWLLLPYSLRAKVKSILKPLAAKLLGRPIP